MLVTAHIRIAKQVREILRDRFDAKISFAAFALGSIFPDFSIKTHNGKHDFCDAVNSAKKIVRAAPQSKMLCSFRLGIVCHYITDSFCDAHIKPAKYTKLSHFKYEARQAGHIRREAARAKMLAQLASYPTKHRALLCYLQQYSDFIKHKRTYREECAAAVQGGVIVIHGLI